MQGILSKSFSIIARAMATARRPAVLTSFGKDSMVLLWLVREWCIHHDRKMPECIFFREPHMPAKYKFANDIIEAWDLTVHDWRPSSTWMMQRGDEFEVMNRYAIGASHDLPCPTGIRPPVPGRRYLCALEDIYDKPVAPPSPAPWDVLLIGHKGCDTDAIQGGDVGSRVDWRVIPGCPVEIVFPIRDWTNADIWGFSADNNVPQNHLRYVPDGHGEMTESADTTWNPDYFEACTACMDRRPDAPKHVPCPKRGGLMIENTAAHLRWMDPECPPYMQPPH